MEKLGCRYKGRGVYQEITTQAPTKHKRRNLTKGAPKAI